MKLSTDKDAMSKAELIAIRSLREKGWGVILWEPWELDGVDPEVVEDSSIAHGWDVIAMNGGKGLCD